jgi:SulP family sulfate permease
VNYLSNFFKTNKKYIKNDTLAGITVALALIPEAIAFAFVAGVSPLLSLQTAVIIGFVAAIFSGRPGMISASTAAISIVFAPLIAQHGLEYLFATVILMGIIQVLIGIFRFGKYTSIIPRSVVLGFLNGLAIVIFLAQWAQFQIHETVIIDGVETIQKVWLPFMDIVIMLLFVALTMGIIHFFPKVTKAVPSSLIAITSITVLSLMLSKYGIYNLITVQDFAGMEIQGAFPSFYIPQIDLSFEMLRIIFPYAFVGALVGLTEAALTLRVLDDMTETKGHMNKEFFAQGAANTVNGFFGGMGGDAMIGQSIVNIKSGGRTRFSGIVASVGLLIFIIFAAPLVNSIPLASLIGLMFMVVISTFAWESLKYGKKIPRQDIFVIAVVSSVTVFADLATAVIVGVLLSTVMFAWEKGKRLEVDISTNTKGHKIYKINGIIFFGSVLNFKNLFNSKTDPKNIILDLKYAKVMDFSAIEAINSVAEKYQKIGKEFVVTRVGDNCRVLLKNAEHITSIKVCDNYDFTNEFSQERRQLHQHKAPCRK